MKFLGKQAIDATIVSTITFLTTSGTSSGKHCDVLPFMGTMSGACLVSVGSLLAAAHMWILHLNCALQAPSLSVMQRLMEGEHIFME